MGVPTDPGSSPNGRTPSLDLDSVYGAGPVASPQLYDTSDRAKLRIESGGVFEDLPRDAGGSAIVADPRNDENLMIAGLQCAFILFHNSAVDWARAQRVRGRGVRAGAAADDVALPLGRPARVPAAGRRPGDGRRRAQEGAPLLQAAHARGLHSGGVPGGRYRFGHSMVRPSYRANLKGDDGNPFFAMVFDPAGEGQSDPVDLRGGARAPRRFIGWQTFFDFGDGEVKPNKRIDTKISTPLFDLPLGAIASHDTPQSLPQRNLLRQLTWSLPSGQAIAKAMGFETLTPDDLKELKPYGFDKSTPLWYYVLREAELRADGLTSGQVGGRIVAEVPDRTDPERPQLVPGAEAQLDTDTHRSGSVVPDEGLPLLRRGRPGQQA